MKISYRNHQILEKLKNGSLGTMPMFEEDLPFHQQFGQAYVNNWKFYLDSFRSEINLISNTFKEAAAKAQTPLLNLWQDLCVNDTADFHVKGTFVISPFVYMIDYDIRKGQQFHELVFYMFDKEGKPLAMYIDSAKYKIFQNGWVSSCFSIENKPEAIQAWIYAEIGKLILFAMFKTYAEVETKHLPANSKVKDIECKYVNDTDLNLVHLDSKWFTNLVQSEGFTVRGHFRLQPKKMHGKWTRELIWISEFQKTGYTAPARKIAYAQQDSQYAHA